MNPARRSWSRRLRRRLGAVWAWVEAALFVMALLPAVLLPYRAGVGLYGWLGRTLLPLTPFARRISDNLALVGAPWSPRAVAAGVGDNFLRTLVEYGRLNDLTARPGLRRTQGVEHLRAAMAQGRGAVLVSAHYGNWEVIRLAARDAGIEVGIIYRAFNNPVFDRMAFYNAGRAGKPVMRKGRAGQRDMLRHLKGGGAILILLDQRLGDGVELDFLGAPTRTSVAVAALAQRLGAALIPAVARRRDDGLSFDVTFEPPVTAPTPEATMAAINARFGAWITAAPGQWFWLHRRWKGVRRG
jgi:KDO2-lipid IV(A) lauroyltransferase